MSAALDLFNPKVARIIQGGIIPGLHKGKLIQNRVSVPRLIQQELRSGVEGNQKILIHVMAGLDKLRQRIARALNLIAAHRARDVEEHANRNRGVIIAKKSYLLRFLLVEYRER